MKVITGWGMNGYVPERVFGKKEYEIRKENAPEYLI